MAICLYCGKPAGLFRKFHRQCRDQHQNAVAMIPTFFLKILASPLPASRFSELLHDVANASHISADQLRSLFLAGIRTVVDETLKTRLLNPDEEKRIADLKASFGLSADDMPDNEDKLFKVAILRALNASDDATRVEVGGPMPIDLPPDERVLWIFNRVACYRFSPKQNPGVKLLDLTIPADGGQPYFPPAALGATAAPKWPKTAEGSGDLVVTNFNIYFFSEGQIRRIPLGKVTALHGYADGVLIARGASEQMARTFILDDRWFAVNLLAGAIRRLAERRPRTKAPLDRPPRPAPT